MQSDHKVQLESEVSKDLVVSLARWVILVSRVTMVLVVLLVSEDSLARAVNKVSLVQLVLLEAVVCLDDLERWAQAASR